MGTRARRLREEHFSKRTKQFYQNGEKRTKNTQAVAVGSICEGQYKGGAGCGGKEWKGRTPLCHLSLLVEGGIRRGEGQLQNRPGILPPMASGEEGEKSRRQRLTRGQPARVD